MMKAPTIGQDLSIDPMGVDRTFRNIFERHLPSYLRTSQGLYQRFTLNRIPPHSAIDKTYVGLSLETLVTSVWGNDPT